MSKLSGLLGLLSLAIIACAPLSAAHAQATRTWVSGVGDDANPCSRTAPCKTFAGAIAKTAASGEINVLDPGGFGAVTITKAITISNEGVGEAGVLVAGTNGIVINAQTTDTVVLRGLVIDGVNLSGGQIGIDVIQAQKVVVENCVIMEMGTGITILPNSGTTTTFSIDHSSIFNNSGGGIRVDGSSGGTAKGIISDTMISHNGGNGVNAVGGSGVVRLNMNRDVVTSNGTTGTGAGIQANGATASVNVGETNIANNVTTINATGGGQIFTFGNNQVVGNVGTAFSGTVALQ